MDGPVLGPRVMVALAEGAARHAPAHGAFLSRHPRRGAALMSAFGPLISADWLHAHIGDPDVRVIDFRWYLVGRQGAEEYANGHIPGAAFVELDDVTGKGPGRHPLPTLEQLQAAIRVAGGDDATAVVVYDDVGGTAAARPWLMLPGIGHARQAVLDGAPQASG